jgi:hypothetical protein
MEQMTGSSTAVASGRWQLLGLGALALMLIAVPSIRTSGLQASLEAPGPVIASHPEARPAPVSFVSSGGPAGANYGHAEPAEADAVLLAALAAHYRNARPPVAR